MPMRGSKSSKRKSFRLRERDEGRAEILNAARAALRETDFPALTVGLVMKRTEMTRSAFYHYFSGLGDVAVALIGRFDREVRATVDSWLEGEDEEGDPLQATVRHLTDMFRVIAAHRRDVRAVIQAAAIHPNVYSEWLERAVQHDTEHTAAFIRRQVERGLSQVEDPDGLAYALLMMTSAVFNDQVTRETPDEPAVVGRIVADVWNAAIFGRAK